MKNRKSLIITAFLVALLTACSKHSPPAAKATPAVPPNLIAAKLGVVEVSDGVPSRHDIGDGRVCIIKPTILKDGDIMMAISVAETNGLGDKTISSLRLETLSDQAVDMANGIIAVSLTAHIVQTNDPSVDTVPLVTRALALDSTVLSQMRSQLPPKAGEASQDYLLRYFKTQQIEFTPPATLMFDETSGRLTVRATVNDLNKIERLVFKP